MSGRIAFKIVWLTACLAVLAMTIYSKVPDESSDIGIFFVACMFLLTFPAGFAIAAIITLLVIAEEKSGVRILALIESNLLGTILMWLAFVAIGYWQWFRLLPGLWLRIRPIARQ